MARKFRRMMALALVLILCIAQMALPASAKGGNGGGGNGGGPDGGGPDGGSTSSSEYEWYQVYVNGSLVDSDQGTAGDHTWLVQGVYSWNVSISGTTMSWRAGAHSGTVNLANYISIPDGYEIAEGGYTVEHKSVEGDNSQADSFDNAIITVTITVLYNQDTGETVPVETEPEVTEPEVTEPEVTEPEVTEPEVTEPEVTEPEVTEPEVTEPEVTEPEVTEPEVTEPEVTEPEVTEPEVTEPEVTEPEVTEPEVTEPEVTEPEVTEPEVTEPEVTEPEVTEPEVTEPEVTEPEVTEPEVTEPEVTEPEVTEPEVTEPEVTEPEETEPAEEEEDDTDYGVMPINYYGDYTDIPDEDVPLADVPQTGDISLIWVALSLASGGMYLASRKREED